VSQDTRKWIRTLKMTLLAKAFFATAQGVILDEGRMKFCRFEKRERSHVPGDRSFQLGGRTSENVWDALKFRGKLWQLFSAVDVNAEKRFVTISGVPRRISTGTRNRWRTKNNALFVGSCTSLCRQFAKIELSARRSDLSLRGLHRRACDLHLRDEKSWRCCTFSKAVVTKETCQDLAS